MCCPVIGSPAMNKTNILNYYYKNNNQLCKMYIKYDIYLHLHHSSQTTSLFAHTNASRVSGERDVRLLPSILPAQLKADSEDTVLTGIDKKSLAIKDRIGYASEFFFHQARTLKFSPSLTTTLGSSK
jgi:hypothetical protein